MFADNYRMYNAIHDSLDTKAIHVQMQQNLDNIQDWQVARNTHATQMPGNDHLQQEYLTICGFIIIKSPTIDILQLLLTRNWPGLAI